MILAARPSPSGPVVEAHPNAALLLLLGLAVLAAVIYWLQRRRPR